MADKPVTEVVAVDAALDALVSPTSSDVYEALDAYSDQAVGAVAAKRALSGGGGGGDVPFVGTDPPDSPTDGELWWDTDDDTPVGSQPGPARVLGPFPFAFDDVGLADGIAFYTPTIDDIWLDVWVECLLEFTGGTTPTVNVGTFVGTEDGVLSAGTPRVLDSPDVTNINLGDGLVTDAVYLSSGLLSTVAYGARLLPARFIAANPLKVVVSQNGRAGGDPTGASAGNGTVYIVVATPSLT